MSKRPKHNKRRARPQVAILRGLVFFFFFLALELVFEHRDQLEPGKSSCEIVHGDVAPEFYDVLYPWFTQHLLGKASSGRVAIVFIPEDLIEVQQNLCRGRSYVAALVNVLAAKHPAAIVVDKYFSGKSCLVDGAERASTTYLQDSVHAARAAGSPVIVGEATNPAHSRTDNSCLVQNPDYLIFDKEHDVPRGLTKLNANREEIPLQWLVFDEQPTSPRERSRPRDSLALLTAKTVSPEIVGRNPLQELLKGSRQPYVRLDLDFHPRASTDLLCSAGTARCSPILLGGASSPYGDRGAQGIDVEGKVVLIGSRNGIDQRLVLGQYRWGYELQASYIDAILSEKYLKALPGRWMLGLSIAFLLILEAVPALFESKHGETQSSVLNNLLKDGWWLVFWSLLFLGVVLACCLHFQYLPPLSVLIGVVLTMVARGIFIGMEHSRKQMSFKREPEP